MNFFFYINSSTSSNHKHSFSKLLFFFLSHPSFKIAMGGKSAAGMGMMMVMFMVMTIIIAPHAEGVIQCNEVYGKLSPCINFATGSGPLTGECCNGVKTLYSAAKTTPDRQGICKCLKQVSGGGGPSVNTGNIQSIPGKCGVNLPYKISPNMDCATYVSILC